MLAFCTSLCYVAFVEPCVEWHRVLRPGGLLMIAVPDLAALARMYVDPSLDLNVHWLVTRMMYGGQTDEYDYHLIGFDEPMLAMFLRDAGFCNTERVRDFNLGFSDASSQITEGYAISLNMIARPCKSKEKGGEGGFAISHQASPYVASDYK